MSLKDIYRKGWLNNAYTVKSLADRTNELGNTTKRFSYVEFEEMTGFSYEWYLSHSEEVNTLRRNDLVELGYLS